jgi:hypothetical protein
VKLELNDRERQAVGRALAECKARLIENTGDTTQNPDARRSGLRELAVIGSVQGKLLPRRPAVDKR